MVLELIISCIPMFFNMVCINVKRWSVLKEPIILNKYHVKVVFIKVEVAIFTLDFLFEKGNLALNEVLKNIVNQIKKKKVLLTFFLTNFRMRISLLRMVEILFVEQLWV